MGPQRMTGALVESGSLAGLLAQRVEERPDQALLFVEDEGPWSVGRLAAAASSQATTLAELGVGPGERVVVRLGNDERFLAARVAVRLRGGAAIAVPPAAPTAEGGRS